MLNSKSSPLKRVLHLVPDLDFGGVESVLEILAQRPNIQGWKNIFVATRGGGRAADAIRAQGHLVLVLGSSSRIPDFLLLLRLVRILQRIRPDIIHCRCVEANFHGVFAAKLAGGIPVVLEEVGLTSDRRSWLAKNILKRVYSLGAAIICQSLAIRRDLKTAGISHPCMPVFYNPVDPCFLAAKIKQPHSPCLTAVSRLVPEKNLQLLLHAFARLPPSRGLRLEICGDGPLRDELQALAARLNIDSQIIWQGFRERNPANLSRASVYVLTSEREGHPVALLEALAAGIPVVATGVGGVREILHRPCRCGILVPNGNEEELVSALKRMLRMSRAGRIKMGHEARKIALHRFSPFSYIERLYQFYSGLLLDSYSKKTAHLDFLGFS